MRKPLLALAGAAVVCAIGAAMAQEMPPLPHEQWSFQGPFGTFDRAAAQRGFQIYNEVCSNCHSMNLLHYGDLTGIGYTEDEVKAIASTKQVTDGPNDQGEMFKRPGRPSDKFAAPFPNEQAARATNNGAYPPDLSVRIKALDGGPDEAFGILTGYKDPPPGFKMGENMQYNEYFAGHQIAMPPPLSDNAVTFADGTKATIAQEAHDVVTFLTWASEPSMEDRKRTGAKVIIFLLVMTGALYGAKRKIWADVH